MAVRDAPGGCAHRSRDGPGDCGSDRGRRRLWQRDQSLDRRGQMHGGIAQAVGQALAEQVFYDGGGQLLSGSLGDYAVPRAGDMPPMLLDHTVTPSPLNPLGAKGVGEAGTNGCPPAIANAIMDALAPLGIRHLDMPFTSDRVWEAIQSAGR